MQTTNVNIFGQMEDKTKEQLERLIKHPKITGDIAIMPDNHPSHATLVGLSIKQSDNCIPALLGSDIGCGLHVVEVKGKTLKDYAKLDKVIRENIPSGDAHRDKVSKYIFPRVEQRIKEFCSEYGWHADNYLKAISSLGKGNHFISLEQGESGTYLLIHTGSRNFGNAVYLYFMEEAIKENCYEQGFNKQLSYLSEDHAAEYNEAVRLCMDFAENNRFAIAQTIIKEMNWKELDSWDIPHNYQDDFHIRKGSIYISHNVTTFIPINMADGTLMVRGYSAANYKPWNYSLPHGAGRALTREQARNLDMKEFKNSMQKVFSSCVNINTIEECPKAYKSSEYIEECIEPMVEIIDRLKPVYNFKGV